MNPRVKAALKGLRASQPFNAWLTSAVRFGCASVGWLPDRVVMHVLRYGDVVSALPDGRALRFWSQGDDGVANAVFWRGWTGSERETAPLFYSLARTARVTLDIGAHVGYYSVLAGLANPSGRVYAFEPLRAICVRLENNLRLNQLTHAEVVPKAVSATVGQAEFFHTEEGQLPTSSSLSSAFMGAAVKSGLQKQLVEITTVDTFVREHDIAAVDLVKIDTETTEPEVLRGMMDTLRRDRPDIVCEVLEFGDTGRKIQPILEPLGYRFYHLRDSGPTLTDRIEPHPRFLNYFFTARDFRPTAQGLSHR
jgi:FkbM family methyltransferase